MQKIAAENNLSETAFVIKGREDYRIRWFAPNCRAPLGGQATLAAARVLWFELGDRRRPGACTARVKHLQLCHPFLN